jgi:hypothetical protein
LFGLVELGHNVAPQDEVEVRITQDQDIDHGTESAVRTGKGPESLIRHAQACTQVQ